jgi:hypothetical protein
MLLAAGWCLVDPWEPAWCEPPAAKTPVEPADNSYCFACHANYEQEKLAHTHQLAGVGCEKCHGLSDKHSGDEDNITPPDKMFPKEDINRFCLTCHEEGKLRKSSDHKEWMQELAGEETCNECHGKTHRLKVRTRIWDKRTRKLIKDDGVRMMSQATPDDGKQAAAKSEQQPDLFAAENLVAWCIVPFDAKRRGPEERAAMLDRLGIRQLAYDWRAEHIPTFDAELDALKKHNIRLTAFWFPHGLNENARKILDLLQRHQVRTQLWVAGGGAATKSVEEQQARIKAEADCIRPIAVEAAKIGCTVELYNHGGWFGEPDNQIAIIEQLKLDNVGIVYNLHHGHTHLDQLPTLLKRMLPYLHAVNLNGMVKDGGRRGMKILPLGQGDLDLDLLKTIRQSGFRGPIGILNHTSADAELRLQDNLDGLRWLVAQMDGIPPGPKPVPRSWTPPVVKPDAKSGAR